MGGGGGTPQPVYFGQDPIPVSPFAWLYNRPAELHSPKGQPSSGDGASIMPVPVLKSPGIPLPPEGPAELYPPKGQLYPPKGQPSSGDGASIMPVPVRPSPGIPPVATGTQPTQRRRMPFDEGFALRGGIER